MVNTILSSYPDGRAAGAEYVAQLIKQLAALTPEEMGWVMDRREGLVARCPKYLPTAGEVMELIRDRCARRDAVRPSPTSYRRLKPDEDIEVPPPAVRRSQVQRLLGYDPAAPVIPVRREKLVPPTTEDLKAVAAQLKLKPPAQSDATPSLRKALVRQGEDDTTWR